MDERENTQETTRSGYCFHGGFDRAMDPKGRFNLPTGFLRSAEKMGAQAFILFKGPDGQLELAPDEVYQASFDRLREGEPGRDKRSVMRRMSSGSRILEADSHGRIAIPAEFLAMVGITKRIYLIGMGDYIELWDPDRLAIIDAALGNTDPKYMDRFVG